ncbi:dipeptide ABC transporter ATP-binding protein [Paracoccus aminophilus]|uniref:ABC-type dipeptide/oligopeptide/nickel transport system, ATPase component n=1 Tax=Paracoccus aminophilus JCM 7686 TaxID=1367847 RepID=S5XZR9_PARAH|nr:ABC transporter ATP-binding protein [Paracoccus aminophilus]AGT10787.1 ABC-type dipeptide/oligopeptide/nickel transport system, ATPase component [Paracoccus aminophilus JCM 7686]
MTVPAPSAETLAETPPLFRIQNLSVGFAGREERIVEEISLSVRAGETLALVGVSGSGKSISLLAATGLAPRGARVSGEVWFEGRPIHNLRGSALRALRGARIGYVFQDPQSNLHPYKTIFTQISETILAHAPRPRPTRAELRRRVNALLADVGIRNPEARLDDLPRQFSGGMRQRVMIAMALAFSPSLLIADEPTTALDVTVQAQILALLKELQQKRGLAVLFVSHDLAVVSDIADRLVVMQDGRIVEEGEVLEVMRRPRHPYARKLLAAAGLAHGLQPAGPLLPRAPEAPRKPLLRASEISRRFPGNHALRGVDLEVASGEIVALVGESGSGKTTLGRIIAGLDRADGGRVLLDGERLEAPFPPALRHEVQVVFQDPYASLNPHRRIGAILADPLRRAGRPHDAEAVADLMQTVRLDPGLAQRLPGQLSGGQRQRVAIARALAPRPRLIVADEPVSALDITTQAEILALFTRLRAEMGLSILLITHDLGVVARYCDRLAVLEQGQIVEAGPTGPIFAAPAHPYTRRLLDAVPGRRLRDLQDGRIEAAPLAPSGASLHV